jgi:insulysin
MKLITLLLTAMLTQQPTYVDVPDQSTLTLLNPDLKERITAKIRLNNGMDVLIISDPQADQSSAAVSVAAGSWDDPEEYPGMAHFCEHMLFLGTKKYPDCNEFMNRVTDFGGQTNAFTAPHQTVYMFSCKEEGFLDNLDRFSRFFIDPLFDTAHISRELHAVDQEYAKNLENDRWREYMVFKELSNPNHPNRKFSSGNSETLKGIPSDSLVEWHGTHYGAEKTRLFVYSSLPANVLKDKIAAFFDEVPGSRGEAMRSEEPMLVSQEQIAYIKPIVHQQIFTICWELPRKDDPSQSAELIAYAINRGQANSLYEKLKKEQLINTAHVSVEEIGGKEHRLFYLILDLTEKGVRELPTAIHHCFEAIAGLKETGIPESMFLEKNAIARLAYQYQSRQDAFKMAQSIGESMSSEDLATYPKAQLLAETYSPETIAEVLGVLAPNTCYMALAAPPELTGVQPICKERWFQAEYTLEPLKKEWIAMWEKAKPNPDILLAGPNPFLPTRLDLVTGSEKVPVLMSESENGIAYYCRAPEFNTPEAVIHLRIRSPEIKSSAKSEVLGALYLDHLTDMLHPTLTAAAAAGLNAKFDLAKLKLHVQISGFSDKAPLLLQDILRQMPEYPPTQAQFEVYYSRWSKDFANADKALPVFQAKDLLDSILVDCQFSSSEKLAALQAITYEEFAEFHRDLLQNTYAEALFAGNLTLKEAQSSWLDVQHILSTGVYPKSEHAQAKILELPNSGPFSMTQTTAAMGNATILTIDEGPFTFETRAAQEILGSALREAFFNELRTKQKTGYIAKAEPLEIEERLFHLFLVQSNSHNPDDLLYRFEHFFEEFLQAFQENVPSTRFENLKHSAIQSLKTRFRNLNDKSALWDLLAFEKRGDFTFIDKRIAALEALTYDQFTHFAKEKLARTNLKRLAILFEGKLNSPFAYRETTLPRLREISQYTAKEPKAIK